jgi:hypothetical protein
MQPHHRAQLIEQLASIRTKIDSGIARAARAANDRDLAQILRELKTLREQRQEIEVASRDESPDCQQKNAPEKKRV